MSRQTFAVGLFLVLAALGPLHALHVAEHGFEDLCASCAAVHHGVSLDPAIASPELAVVGFVTNPAPRIHQGAHTPASPSRAPPRSAAV